MKSQRTNLKLFKIPCDYRRYANRLKVKQSTFNWMTIISFSLIVALKRKQLRFDFSIVSNDESSRRKDADFEADSLVEI